LCRLLVGHLEEVDGITAEGVKINSDIAFNLSLAYGRPVMRMRASLDGDYELG